MKILDRKAMYAVIGVGAVFIVDACATGGTLTPTTGDGGNDGWGTGGQTASTSSSTTGSGGGAGGGGGGCKSAAECPASANPCVLATCEAGSCGTMNAAANMACGVGTSCDGQGNCVGCVTGADCPGLENECSTRTCTNGTCGVAYSPLGTQCNQTGACDGAGTCKLTNGDPCTKNEDCLVALCVDSVCCESDCSGMCMACNVPGSVGKCTNVRRNGGLQKRRRPTVFGGYRVFGDVVYQRRMCTSKLQPIAGYMRPIGQRKLLHVDFGSRRNVQTEQ